MISFSTDIHHEHRHASRTATTVQCALLIAERSGQRFVTRHPVEDGVMGVGSLINNADVDQLLAALRHGKTTGGRFIVPDNVLFQTDTSTAWLLPAKVRPMHFALNGAQFTRRVPWPDLVMFAERGQVWVAAIKGQRRDPEQPVFHAPLMNIYNDGRVCMPSGTVIPDGPNGMQAAEDMMFGSAFSHANHATPIAASTRGKGAASRADATTTLDRFYRTLEGKTTHPTRRWVPTGMTLQRWLATR